MDAGEHQDRPTTREELRRLIDAVAERFADFDPDEHEREVQRAIAETRAELRVEADALAATRTPRSSVADVTRQYTCGRTGGHAMAAPRLEPEDQDRVPISAGGIALARQRAERGQRTVVVDEHGTPVFLVSPIDDLNRLKSDDIRRRAAAARILEVGKLFTDPDAGEQAMEAAMDVRAELRVEAERDPR